MVSASQGRHPFGMQSVIDEGGQGGGSRPASGGAERMPPRRAVPADVEVLTGVLVRAFDDDPFINWLVRQDARRADGMRWTFDVMLRQLSCELNETYTNSELSGCAIWKSPGQFKLPLLTQLRLLPAFARALGGARIPRFLRLLDHMEKVHDRLVPEPHFYLFVLGVEPNEQRRGLGGVLLGPVLARCEQEQTRAFLETSRVENLPFYNRHGFEVAHVVERAGWPTFWLMVRKPGAVAGSLRERSVGSEG